MNDQPWGNEAGNDAAGATAGHVRSAIHFPPFRLDAHEERLWRGKQLIALRPKTFAVLRYLLERPQQLIRKEELLERLWGDVYVNEAVLKTYLREIRQALGDSAKSPRFIETAHRRGYRFIGRVLVEREGLERAAPSLSTQRQHTVEQKPPRAAELHTFVGRETELERLDQALRLALARERQVLFVTGEPGIGKTTLVRAFLERLRAKDDLALAWGQCVDQYGAGEAYLPILEALRRLSRGPHRRQLARALRRDAPTWLSHVPGLVEATDLAGGRYTPGAPPERMLCEMAEALEAFTQDQPLVLWLEDLHWADHATLACLSYLARRSDPARLLLLGTYRPLEVLSGHPLAAVHPDLLLQGRCDELRLSFLSEADVAVYFARRFSGHRFPPELSRLTHARTEGNPLFLDRVVDSWVKRRLLSQSDQGWELSVALEQVAQDTPASVVLMVERESERLAPFERSVLDAASAMGTQFWTASLAAALGEEVVRVEELCLLWARRRQFFQLLGSSEWPDGTTVTRFEFIHAVYQQVAYERIGMARRAQLHLRIGEREEAGYRERARDIAPELAVHFERGQDYSRAVSYLAAAGEQALRRSACTEAIAHYRKGLELLGRLPQDPERLRLELELLVALGAPLAMIRGHAASEVEAVYARARDLCQDMRATSHHFQALMGVGAFYLVRGEYRTACALGEQFRALALEQHDPGVSLQVSLLRGISLIFLGDLSAAQAELEHTIALYDPELHHSHIYLYMQDPCVCAHSLLVLPLWILGYPEQAMQHAQRALELAQQLTHPAAVVLAFLSLAQIEQLRGESQLVREHTEAGLAVSIKHGFALYHQTLTMLHGAALTEQGELERGLSRIQEGWDALSSTGSEFAGARWRSLLAESYAKAGRASAAFNLLVEAISRVDSHAERWWEPELYRVLGELLAQPENAAVGEPILERATGQVPRTAEACLLRALELARATRARAFELRAALSLARLWRARGPASPGLALVSSIYQRFGEGFETADLREARRFLESDSPNQSTTLT